MKIQISPAAFTIAFCCTYALVFAMNRPLFLYYPLHGNFNWGAHVTKGIGPAIAWYGLMADAGIVALLAALCVPSRVLNSTHNYVWVFPVGAMLVAVFLLRRLFM